MIIMCPSWQKISANMRKAIDKGKLRTPEVSNYRENFTPKRARQDVPTSSLYDAPTFKVSINAEEEDFQKPMLK